MNKRIVLAALLCLPLAAIGAEAKRITITSLAGGKELSTLMLPVSRDYKLEFAATKLEYPNENAIHAQGNVRITIRFDRKATTVLGEDILVSREILDDKKVAAIRALEGMRETDQQYRRLATFASERRLQTLQSSNDRRNQEKLRAIVATYGWPGTRFAGADGAQAAFLVLQHSPAEQLQAMLPQLQAAQARNDIPATELALAEDRVLVARGMPQKYGTQLDLGTPSQPFPIEDEANVDMRRQQIGLAPLRDYLQLLGVPCRASYCSPASKAQAE